MNSFQRTASLSERVVVPTSIFLFALLIRLIFFLQMSHYPLLDHLGSDPRFYYDAAVRILRTGDWMGDRIFFASPFYQYFLACIFFVFGIKFLPVRIIQFFIGSATGVLVFLIGERCFGRRAGIAAGLLYSLYLLFPFYELTLEYDPLLLCAVMLLIYFSLTLEDAFTFRKCFFLGSLLAVSFAMRPNVLLALIPAWLWVLYRENRLSGPKVLGGIALFILGFSVLVLPITLRNYRIGKEWVLISAHGGEAFYTGNNPHTDGAISKLPGIEINFTGEERDFLKLAAQAGRSGHRAASDFWYYQGIRFIRENPLAYFKLLLKKIVHLMRNYEIPDNNDYQFAKTFFSPLLRWVSRIDFGFILALSIYGFVTNGRPRNSVLFLWLFLISNFCLFLLFPIISRYRLLVVPPLIVLAGASISSLVESVQKRAKKKLFSFFLIVPLVYLLSHWKIDEEAKFAHSYLMLGAHRSREGKSDEAIRHYQKALSKFPASPEACASLAYEYHKNGNTDEAIRYYRKTLRYDASHVASLNNLALLEYQRSRLPQALKYIQRASQSDSPAISTTIVKAKILRALGKEKRASFLFEKARQMAEQSGDEMYLLYISSLTGKKGI